MPLHARAVVLALGLGLLATGPALALQALIRGPQTLTGVIVSRNGLFSVLLDAGSMSEQSVSVTGAKAVLEQLRKVAIPARELTETYDGCTEYEVRGDLNSGFAGWIFMAGKVSPVGGGSSAGGPSPADKKLAAATAAFREEVQNADSAKATAALTILERAGLLDLAVKAALAAGK